MKATYWLRQVKGVFQSLIKKVQLKMDLNG